jgi:hypothetical protein
MHEQLWAGADLKIQHAAFFLQEMSRSIERPEQTTNYVVQVSSGAIVGNLWAQSFYARFDALLAMTRSIPEIITCCFGYDRAMATWLKTLSVDEQTRRQRFSTQFEADYNNFRQHPLSNVRNISFHRAGYPSVEVRITGHFGVEHIGSPVKSVPIAEINPNHFDRSPYHLSRSGLTLRSTESLCLLNAKLICNWRVISGRKLTRSVRVCTTPTLSPHRPAEVNRRGAWRREKKVSLFRRTEMLRSARTCRRWCDPLLLREHPAVLAGRKSPDRR